MPDTPVTRRELDALREDVRRYDVTHDPDAQRWRSKCAPR